jgi:hypothetical protein
MRLQDIKIGEYYRHKEHPNYAWAKAIKVCPPHSGINNNNYFAIECEWTIDKNDTFGLIKYFRPQDLVLPKE